MGIIYPITLKASSRFIEAFFYSEYGRWEDAESARRKKDAELIERNEYQCVYCDFGDKFKTLIRIETEAELLETYYALASSNVGLESGLCRTANRLLDEIRDRVESVDPELVETWRYNSGY